MQLAVLALLIAAFFVRLPQVSGFSMEPHIRSGEYVLINTFAYRFGPPRRGEIVAFRHESDARAVFIKRVIGLPGDRIRIHGDDRSFTEIRVPPACVYVLGDNRAESEDSRTFGPVRDDQLIGRAFAGIWPPRMLGGN
jgi:signal peptidase I